MPKQPKTIEEMQAELHPWWRIAYQHAQKNQTWFKVVRSSEEHKAWTKYFDRLGWCPLFFISGNWKEVTLPCQWPEWMPAIGDDVLAAAPKRAILRPAVAPGLPISSPTMEELRARYGPNWGLKVQAHQKRAKREWTPPTDEDLLRMYGKREAS